jgi:uncharacterized damage-inducible protein DinB
MLEDLSLLFKTLEEARTSLVDTLGELSEEQLQWKPGPDRWSILMALQHIVTGEKGMRQTYEELANHPLRDQLKTGKMADVVLDILNRDVQVEVPDPGLEPDGNTSLAELLESWSEERQAMAQLLETVTEDTRERVMFNHPAAGPMDAAKTLELAVSHLNHHRRHVDRILTELAQVSM